MAAEYADYYFDKAPPKEIIAKNSNALPKNKANKKQPELWIRWRLLIYETKTKYRPTLVTEKQSNFMNWEYEWSLWTKVGDEVAKSAAHLAHTDSVWLWSLAKGSKYPTEHETVATMQ